MLETLLGMSMSARLVQRKKADPSILVTPLGIVTLIRSSQSENVEPSMLVTPSGMVTPGPDYTLERGGLYMLTLLGME